MDKDTLRSYFGEYSPSAKDFQTLGGQDEFFHEVAKFMLEVGFVTPRFYGMPKKRAGFIIATYKGEIFDWGWLLAKALCDQLYGVQQKGKPMKTIFARWLSMLFPPQGSDNQQEERRPPRPRRPVQREEWWEAESVQVDTTQPKSEQQQSVPSPVSESTQNRPPDSVPVTPLPEPNQEVALIEPSQPTQRPRRMKQKAQRFPQPWQKVSAQKKRRTRDQATQPTTVPRVNPNDTTRIQEGQ